MVSTHLQESSHQISRLCTLQAKWCLRYGKGCCWKGLPPWLERYQYWPASLNCIEHKILKQTWSSKTVKEVKRLHIKANISYLCFKKGFLLFWHCYTSSASLTAPSCVKFTQALKDCGIPKEIIFQSIEFLMEKPPWMLSYKLEDPLLSK